MADSWELLQDFMLLAKPTGWRSESRQHRSLTDIRRYRFTLVRPDGIRYRTAHHSPERGAGLGGRDDPERQTVRSRCSAPTAGRLAASSSMSPAPVARTSLYFSFDGRETSVMFDQEHRDELIVGGLRANTVVLRDAAALRRPPRGIGTARRAPAGLSGSRFNLVVADVYTAVRTGEVTDGLPTFLDGLRAAHINAAVEALDSRRRMGGGASRRMTA